ncbi:HNH endonuclease signature motif containing protein [Neobacillus drentensis]|uniref:HNH endonuclease signature motif containing protein n=1 Tax=Neobacillus drentensis TaxID=220684 RepID=UPI002FFF92FD
MVHRYTSEEISFLSEHVLGRGNAELLKMFNDHFGLDLTLSQVKAAKKNHGLSSGLDGRFKPGGVPFNKGTKGQCNLGGNRTSFKKGQKPFNFKPIGTERIDQDGYILIKVSDDGPWHKRWRHKHKVVWEEVNGPIPKGHCILFLDTNKQNTKLENLQLITKKQLSRLNQKRLISDNPELTKTGLIIADIYSKIAEMKKTK